MLYRVQFKKKKPLKKETSLAWVVNQDNSIINAKVNMGKNTSLWFYKKNYRGLLRLGGNHHQEIAHQLVIQY